MSKDAYLMYCRAYATFATRSDEAQAELLRVATPDGHFLLGLAASDHSQCQPMRTRKSFEDISLSALAID